jgi:hypothetical protein
LLFTAAMVIVPEVIDGTARGMDRTRGAGLGPQTAAVSRLRRAAPARSLFVLAPGPWWIVAAQATGGLASAVIGIMTPLVISGQDARQRPL